jgi:uncharacterized membrane protein YedE/YeeE
MMGFGMAISAGCPFRLMVRAAEGELSAIGAFAGLIAGIIIFAQVLPWLAQVFGPYTYHGPLTFPQLITQLLGG